MRVDGLKKGFVGLLACVGAAGWAAPLSYGRMTFENFVTEASDGVAGVYFSKVWEPGASTAGPASYIVLGCIYPAQQAVLTDRAGDLTLPETIEGLPVRRVAANAFSGCTKLTSITFPSTLREVGPKAFSFCTSLTNVTFRGSARSGLQTIGEQAFTNCLSLVSVSFPASFRHLSREVFVNCDALQSITFLGNAPELDEPLALPSNNYDARSYLGRKRDSGSSMKARAKIYARTDSYGWRGPYLVGLPEKWPVQYGWSTAHDMVALPAGTGTVIRLAGGD